MNKPSPENAYLIEHANLILDSYQQLIGKELIPETTDKHQRAKALFFAPFAVLSHGTEDDPLFTYANQTALELFEYSWQELTQTPSRLSAEPVNRQQRIQLLEQVTRKGYIDGYQGIRISKTGQRFLIKQSVIWNLTRNGQPNQGQAACLEQWQLIGKNDA